MFVVFDDLSARHNVYGWSQSATPVADAFAKEALVFDRAYCQQAVCSPSRASLLSGRRPDRTQQWTFALPPPNTPGTGGWRNAPGASQWKSFPQWFKSKGYYTAGVGKLCARLVATVKTHTDAALLLFVELCVFNVNSTASSFPVTLGSAAIIPVRV